MPNAPYTPHEVPRMSGFPTLRKGNSGSRRTGHEGDGKQVKDANKDKVTTATLVLKPGDGYKEIKKLNGPRTGHNGALLALM